MKRILFIFVLGILLASTAMAGIAIAANNMLMLRQNIVVRDNVIRLGDLFSNVGARAHVVIAPAPAHGRQAIYDSQWLSALARANGLIWQPSSNYEHAVVERESEIIPVSSVKKTITDHLAQRKQGERFEVEIDNARRNIYVAPGGRATLRVASVNLDERSNRFKAVLGMVGRNETFHVSGRIHDVHRIPVLVSQVKPGATIRKNDIGWITLRGRAVNRDVLTEAEQLVGMSPKRWVRLNKPLRAEQLQEPLMVEKGSLVLIIYKAPGMSMTAKGRAIEDGAKGKVVQVRNAQSGRIIEAVISGPGTVDVSFGTPGGTTQQARLP